MYKARILPLSLWLHMNVYEITRLDVLMCFCALVQKYGHHLKALFLLITILQTPYHHPRKDTLYLSV